MKYTALDIYTLYHVLAYSKLRDNLDLVSYHSLGFIFYSTAIRMLVCLFCTWAAWLGHSMSSSNFLEFFG